MTAPIPMQMCRDASGAGPLITVAPQSDRWLQSVPGFVHVFSHLTGSVEYLSASLAAHLGYGADELACFGTAVLDHIIHGSDLPRFEAHVDRIAQLRDDRQIGTEYRLLTKSGKERWVRTRDAVLDRGPDGQVRRHISCVTDVTAEKHAQRRLDQLRARRDASLTELETQLVARTHQVHETLEELEHLTFLATHDLRVPITNLSRLCIMLEETAERATPEQAEQIMWIGLCAQQISRKIDTLVHVSEVRLRTDVTVQNLSLMDAVGEAVERVEASCSPGAMSVTTQVPDGLHVRFEASDLQVILTTLLDNCLKYADSARALRITLRAGQKGGAVWLRIVDNGSGINSGEETGKVFGLFRRCHKEPAGEGVSLYIARQMLRRAGGALSVQGRRGKGASFKVTFPTSEGLI